MLARLGVNIDHVATLRQLRGTPYPNLLEMARIVEEAGAHQITVHLREDRRHIQDRDVLQLRKALRVPMNLEMAATDAMLRFALKVRPQAVCIVPEKRREVTTEGGLNLKAGRKRLVTMIPKLRKAGIRVSLFIEPTLEAVRNSAELGAQAVELHTGRYCLAMQAGKKAASTRELLRIEKAAREARRLGLEAHAGHGFDAVNVRPVAALELDSRDPSKAPLIEEFNIGHFLVCRAVEVGMRQAVREMLSAIHAP
jgi:pyridoxine 5-phosphate synthase